MNTIALFKLTATKHRTRFVMACFAACALVGLTGCSFLKPAQSTTRYFVLAVVATNTSETTPGALSVGVGPVKLPAYLSKTSFAIRKNRNEVEYLPSANWAEKLDAGFQRVLGANLASLLGTDRVYLSSWQKSDVTAELHVVIEQFDVDIAGRGQLVARWRVVSPGGEQVMQSGTSRLEQAGPTPDRDAAGAAATLSQLVGSFSREMMPAIRSQSTRR